MESLDAGEVFRIMRGGMSLVLMRPVFRKELRRCRSAIKRKSQHLYGYSEINNVADGGNGSSPDRGEEQIGGCNSIYSRRLRWQLKLEKKEGLKQKV